MKNHMVRVFPLVYLLIGFPFSKQLVECLIMQDLSFSPFVKLSTGRLENG